MVGDIFIFLAPIIIYFFSYAIYSFLSYEYKLLKNLIYFLVLIGLSQNSYWLIKNHPYGNVYFNELIKDENKKTLNLIIGGFLILTQYRLF